MSRAAPVIGIRVVSIGEQAPAEDRLAWFGPAGGDIGRSTDCALALPITMRRISRRHARVLHLDGRWLLELLSSALAVELDGRALRVGERAVLGAGQRLRIGTVQFEVLGEPESLGLRHKPAGTRPAMAAQAERAERAERAGKSADAANAADAAHASALSTAAASTALLAGLGLGAWPGGEPGAAEFERTGALLRQMTAGLLALLAARLVAKRELGAEATRLRSQENNPLKFAPDIESALTQLLAPAARGFLPPLDAVREACDDLTAHQVALLAGMRATLAAVLARFDPAALEAQLATGPVLANLIPAQRRARLWSEYCAQYAHLADTVEGELDALLDRAFLQAYTEQLARLAGRRR